MCKFDYSLSPQSRGLNGFRQESSNICGEGKSDERGVKDLFMTSGKYSLDPELRLHGLDLLAEVCMYVSQCLQSSRC